MPWLDVGGGVCSGGQRGWVPALPGLSVFPLLLSSQPAASVSPTTMRETFGSALHSEHIWQNSPLPQGCFRLRQPLPALVLALTFSSPPLEPVNSLKLDSCL